MTTLSPKLSKSPRRKDDVLALIAEALVAKVPALNPSMQQDIASTLHDLLDGRDEQARTTRIGIQYHLIQVAEDLLSNGGTGAEQSEKMLTTEQAAELMACSRPYVAMLIDDKKLAGATTTAGGHRRVPASSVRAWIKSRESQSKDADYKAAGVDAGMYDIPEQTYLSEVKSARKSDGS
jgi:excisionase family DNA binding protein